MATPPDWTGMEERIATLLPCASAPGDRALLLAEVAAYARLIVAEARRVGNSAPDPEELARALRWLERPVFICGHHRSGTTLLQALLDEHPELVVLPSEGTYFTSLGYAARRDPSPDAVDRFVAAWILRFIDPNDEPHFNLGRSTPDRSPSLSFARRLAGWHESLLVNRRAQAPFALLLALLASFRDTTGRPDAPRQWVEKTPLNERHVRRLAQFREARFIQMVRDPRATLASIGELYRAGDRADFDPAAHAHAIGHSLRLADQNQRRFGGRYLVVRYEVLADEPVREMERIRAFLGIAPSPSLLEPTVCGTAIGSNSSFQPGVRGVVPSRNGFPDLSPAYTRLTRAYCAAPARPLGYGIEPLGLASRVATRARHLSPSLSRWLRWRLQASWWRAPSPPD